LQPYTGIKNLQPYTGASALNGVFSAVASARAPAYSLNWLARKGNPQSYPSASVLSDVFSATASARADTPS
jgi:hypothetical protein